MPNAFQKTYAVPKRLSGQYSFSTMVRHQGTIVSFAMDDERRIWYTVLDLANHEERDITSPIDTNYWLNEPRELILPKELAQVGYAIAGYHTITDPTPDKPEKEKTDGEKFQSTTARLSAQADFEVFSDEKYIYLFRQAIDANHADIDKTEDAVAVVDRTLLVDRFLLQGTTLLSKKEVRYQRSRHKDKPQSRKDSLGYADMEKTPFVEPTQELSMIRNLKDGRFTVSLIPSSVPGISRWQIFAYDDQKEMIVSYSIERSVDGLFNLRGTQYYKSPVTDYENDVFQARPGTCPFSHQPLIPVLNQSGSAEYALSFENQNDGVKVDIPSDLKQAFLSNIKGFTMETRIKIASFPAGSGLIPLFTSNLCIAIKSKRVHLQNLYSTSYMSSGNALAMDIWYHIAVTCQPIDNDDANWEATLFLDGDKQGGSVTIPKDLSDVFYLGDYGNYSQFFGQMDEFRIWTRARSREDLQQSLHHRLTGEEPGLALYYRFDESQGTRIVDYGPNALHGDIRGNPTWKVSDAPVGDHPGLRKSAFQVQGREITTGLSSLLYYQQENLPGGYDGEAKPMKYNARVMLSFGTKPTDSSDPNKITCLDFGISREGKLAHIPDVLSIPNISAPLVGNIPYSQYLDDKSRLEGEILTLVSEIGQHQEQLNIIADATAAGIEVIFTSGNINTRLIYTPDIWDNLYSNNVIWEDLYQHFNGGAQYSGYSLYHDPGKEQIEELHLQVQAANTKISNLLPIASTIENLSLKIAELEGKTQTLSGEQTVPMSLVHMDSSGLTLTGGIMDFAESNDQTPHLVESASGKLNLYFNDLAGNFYATYFDTLTGKAVYEIGCVSTRVSLLINYSAPDQVGSDYSLEYEVEDETDGAYYKLTLTIKDSSNNTASYETWPNLPRNPEVAALILNGEISQGEYDYSQVQASGSIITGIIHQQKASVLFKASVGPALWANAVLAVPPPQFQVPPSGSLLLKARVVGPNMDTVELTVENGSDSNHCIMTIRAADLMNIEEVWTDLPRDVELASKVLNGEMIPEPDSYDYGQAVITSDSPAELSLRWGSILFNAIAEQATGMLDNTHIDPATAFTSRNCQWIGLNQGNSLLFGGLDDVIHLDSTLPSGLLDSPDDLTLEAWINPKPHQNDQVLLDHAGDISYQMGLLPSGHFYAGVNGTFVKSPSTIPDDKWSHIAASYDQSYALEFDGTDEYLDCGNDLTLDIAEDLTLEVFLETGSGTSQKGILSKGVINDGQEGQVPYALFLDIDKTLTFYFEDKDGNPHYKYSSSQLAADTLYKIGVTREREYNEAAEECQTIKLFINGTEEVNWEYKGQTAGTNSQSLQIGKSRLHAGYGPFSFDGVISEVRIWNTARDGSDICSPIRGGEKGLVSWWRMEENEGNIAYDSKGNSHATRIGANWIKNPDPEESPLRLYLNGESLNPVDLEAKTYGASGFSLGAKLSEFITTEQFKGEMEELRIWKVGRTEEEIQDNLHRRLLGERAKLLAYYQFDAETGGELTDQSGRGVHLSLGLPVNVANRSSTSPAWMISTAPVSYDTPQIRSALTGVQTDFQGSGDTAMVAREYGDMQYDAEGNMTGAMKRAYTFIEGGKWQLITGFKVGNIVTEWVGQAQYDPQVVGFIEGAPPVPSENLTSTTLTGAYSDYQGISSVELQEAEEITHHFSSSRDNSFDMALEGKMGVGVKSSSSVGGLGFSTEVEKSDFVVGMKFNFDQSFGWARSAQRSQARTQRKQTKMELTGYWEPEKVWNSSTPDDFYYDVGRRFLPYNKGLALVKSETADIFALRLEHNHALIAFRMLPNPDIPKDWNLIHFPINPHYVKQGTLDGRVGFKTDGSVQYDEDYPNAAGYGEYSYFKPREAYALKKRIEREEEMARELYQNFQVNRAANAAKKGAGKGADIGGFIGSHVGPKGAALGAAGGAVIGSAIGGATSSTDLPDLAKRNLMNTFVWTAEGGFFAETQQTMDVIMEETSGSYKLAGMAGMYTKNNAAYSKAAIEYELSAMFGGSLSLATTKSENSTQAFSVEVKCENDGDLQVYVNDKDKDANGQTPQFPTVSTGGAAFELDGKPILRPGKVDAYRFMTFYLQPNLENFEELKNKVIDPVWLDGDSPSVRAMRQAIGAQDGKEKSIPWRIMHRVTYVSRILPKFTPTGNLPQSTEQVLSDASINSNYELIQALNPFVMNKKDDYVNFTDAIRKAVNQYYSELKPAMTDIIEFMSLYHQVFPE